MSADQDYFRRPKTFSQIELVNQLDQALRAKSVVEKRLSVDKVQTFVQGLITGEGDGSSYEQMYPIIVEPNVFSVSTLAFHVQKQIDWKLRKRKEEDGKISTKMFSGRAIHHFLEKGFVNHSENWRQEIELRIHVPYKWENLPETQAMREGLISHEEIILVGHMDIVNFVTAEIVEFKSSTYSDAITDYHKLQAGTYGYTATEWMRQSIPQFNKTFKVYIVKVGGRKGVNAVLMKWHEIENGFSDIVNRGLYCAKKLDVLYGKGQVPLPDALGLDRKTRKLERQKEHEFIEAYHKEDI